MKIRIHTLLARIPKRYRPYAVRTVLTAVIAIIVYAILISSAAILIYGRNANNGYTSFAEHLFPFPAARVNGETIPLSRFRLEVTAREVYAISHNLTSTHPETEQFVINQLVNRTLYAQALEKNGIIITEQDVDNKLNDMYTEVGGQDKLATFLKQNYGEEIDLSQFRQWTRELLVEAAVKQQLLVHATIRHILIAVPEGASDTQVETARKKIVDIKSKITNPESFADIAKEYSEDIASRDKGGTLGSAPRGNTPVFSKEFEDTAFSIPIGVVSDPVRSTYGWHIIQVDARDGIVDKSIQAYVEQLRNEGSVALFVGE